MPYTPGPNASPNALLFQIWLDGLENLDVQRIMDPMDETLMQQVLPASLERPPKNKQECTAHIQGMVAMFSTIAVGKLPFKFGSDGFHNDNINVDAGTY